MGMRFGRLIAVLLAGVLLAGCNHVVSLSVEEGEVSGGMKKGEQLVEMVAIDFSGAEVDFNEKLDGKVGLIDFWAAWCPFCVDEMPSLQKLQEEFGGDLVVIGVHRTETEDVETGQKFADETGAKYLLVQDVSGRLYKAATERVFAGMPVAVYVGRDGVVREIKVGPKTVDEMREKINELLNEQ